MFGLKVLALAVVVVNLENFSVHASISAAQKAALRAASEPFIQECIKEFGFSEEDVKEFKKKHKPSDADPCFMKCVLQKAEVIDDKGMYDVEKASEFTKTHVTNEEDLAEFEKIHQDCAKVNEAEVTDGEKGCERAKLLFDCFKSHKDVMDNEKE